MNSRLIFLIVVFFSINCSFLVSEPILYGTSRHGVYYYEDGDLTKAKGMPKFTRVLRFFSAGGETIFALTEKQGVFFSTDSGKNWSVRRAGLPFNKVTGQYQTLTGFYADKKMGICAAVTRHRIFISRNFGRKWYEVRGPRYCSFNSYHYVAIAKGRRPVIILPTAFNGFQKGLLLPNGKVHWQRGWYGLPGWTMDRRSFTYETVSAALKIKKMGYVAMTAFGKGAYRSSNGRRWRKYRTILPKNDNNLLDMRLQGKQLVLETVNSIYKYDFESRRLGKIPFKKYLAEGPSFTGINCVLVFKKAGVFMKRFERAVARNGKRRLPEAYDRRLRQRLAAGKRAIYLNTWLLRGRYRLQSFINKMKKTKINAVVVDMKDDWGRVVYDSKLPIVRKLGALRNIVNASRLIQQLKKHGIYTIARLVVFKDARLFRYQGGRYAIKDRVTGRPWIGGHSQKEYWVDPHSRFVWEYNISLAEELVRLGFDEIQFDYIRFPTDGNIFRCHYTHRTQRVAKSRVLAGFLKMARERIRIPISIDIYGFNGWYVMGNKQGQDIKELRKYVDVICPMYYPSHFGRLFMKQDVYRILFEGTKRAFYFTGTYALIRPYIQAFRMHAPHYGKKYIQDQVRGCKDGGSSGYILWNMGGSYRTAYKALPSEG